MILFKKSAELHKWIDDQRQNGKSIGFVPTMGALHRGHLSLVKASNKAHPITVCSIFVNPTQFNDSIDFDLYPVTIEKDIDMLEEAGTAILFLPSVKEIYPGGLKQKEKYPLGYLETILEGKFRPGHYQGVCQVVQQLLEIVKPDELFLGQKDYQQCMVLAKLVELLEMHEQTRVTVSPTLREPDGLAMSSRNMRLNSEERKKAPFIYYSLNYIREHIKPGKLESFRIRSQSILEEQGFKLDYFEIADAKTLEPVNDWDGEQDLVTLVAAYLNDVRLIDNLVLD